MLFLLLNIDVSKHKLTSIGYAITVLMSTNYCLSPGYII